MPTRDIARPAVRHGARRRALRRRLSRRLLLKAIREVRISAVAAGSGLGELLYSDDLTHAASIAYYALLSLFPFLLLVVSILGSLDADDADRAAVLSFVFRYFPTQFDFMVQQLDAFRSTRSDWLLRRAGAGVGLARRLQRDHVRGQPSVGGRETAQLLKHRLVGS